MRKPILNKKSLDEIPPDPVNFLREEEDGSEVKSDLQQQQPNRNRKTHQQRPRGPYNNNNNNNNRNNAQSSDAPSFRPRDPHYQQNNNSRPREHQNMRRNQPHENKMDTQNSSAAPPPRRPHPQALRNERRTVSSSVTSSATSNPENTMNEAESNDGVPSPQHVNRQKRPTQKPPRANNNNNNNQSGDRSNMTVKLTDEVRSVKSKTKNY